MKIYKHFASTLTILGLTMALATGAQAEKSTVHFPATAIEGKLQVAKRGDSYERSISGAVGVGVIAQSRFDKIVYAGPFCTESGINTAQVFVNGACQCIRKALVFYLIEFFPGGFVFTHFIISARQFCAGMGIIRLHGQYALKCKDSLAGVA